MIYPGKGYIGCFEMLGRDAGKRQLAEYAAALKAAGHKRIVAPINGDTWHTYRLVSWSGGEAFFPMEPENPLWYNEVYLDAGFRPIKRYSSGRFALGGIVPVQGDVRIRPFDRADAMAELKRIYALSLQGFDDNFLYSDISESDFLALYQPLLPMVDEDLVGFAQVDGKTAGFMFAFPAGDRLILKTIAVLPQWRGAGIGTALMNHVLVAGQRKGLKTAVAALMSEENYSQNIVGKYGSETFREYTLYALEV